MSSYLKNGCANQNGDIGWLLWGQTSRSLMRMIIYLVSDTLCQTTAAAAAAAAGENRVTNATAANLSQEKKNEMNKCDIMASPNCRYAPRLKSPIFNYLKSKFFLLKSMRHAAWEWMDSWRSISAQVGFHLKEKLEGSREGGCDRTMCWYKVKRDLTFYNATTKCEACVCSEWRTGIQELCVGTLTGHFIRYPGTVAHNHVRWV